MFNRNYFIGIMTILLFTMLAACGNVDETKVNTDEQSSETEVIEDEATAEEKGVEVDKGLFNVEITLPAVFFEGDEEIDNLKAEDGVSNVTKNEDGSVTFKMTKAKHREMMDEMETSVNETMDDIVADEDFASIEDITTNSDYSEFTMVVAKEGFENSFDGFATIAIGMSGMLYQLFDGVPSDNLNVEINIEDAATGEIFSTVNYPEAMENME